MESHLRKHDWTPTPFAVGPAWRAAAGPGTRRHSTAAGSPRPAASDAYIVFNTSPAANKTRNQHASPTRQCNTGRPRTEAILTKSCVSERFQKRSLDFLKFFLKFAVVFVIIIIIIIMCQAVRNT